MLSDKDRDILRDLAKQYAEIAGLPEQGKRISMWRALNGGTMVRPMVVIDQLPWHEFEDDESVRLCIENPVLRSIERFLRQTLYKWKNFPADMVVEPYIPIPMAVTGQNYGMEILEETLALDIRSDVVSHQYENQFLEEDDITKLSDMRISYDKSKTDDRLAMAEELFFDICPVKASGIGFNLSLWDILSTLMGVESIYIDLIERPEFLHKIMRRMTDATISGIKQANDLGLHDGNANTCHCSYIYTDDLLCGPGEKNGNKSKDTWAFGMAQLFTSVSPDMTSEFELPYVKELSEHFGGIYYGCCERLDDRMELIFQIPNLRKISCSPWSDRDAFAERIGPKLVMSAKPAPALLVRSPVDYDMIEKDLRLTIEAARRYNVNLEIILKDISTVNYDPLILKKWHEIAMRAVMIND